MLVLLLGKELFSFLLGFFRTYQFMDSMTSALIANIALVTRFLERKVKGKCYPPARNRILCLTKNSYDH
jgi:hypothetical protein